jgi:hypothetical protein
MFLCLCRVHATRHWRFVLGFLFLLDAPPPFLSSDKCAELKTQLLIGCECVIDGSLPTRAAPQRPGPTDYRSFPARGLRTGPPTNLVAPGAAYGSAVVPSGCLSSAHHRSRNHCSPLLRRQFAHRCRHRWARFVRPTIHVELGSLSPTLVCQR